VARLREMGADTIRCTFDKDGTGQRELLEGLGFEFDLITMSRYDTDGGPPGPTVGGGFSS
jgi:hypothetical protein